MAYFLSRWHTGPAASAAAAGGTGAAAEGGLFMHDSLKLDIAH